MSHNHLPYSISPISFEDLHIDDGDNDDDDDDDEEEEKGLRFFAWLPK